MHASMRTYTRIWGRRLGMQDLQTEGRPPQLRGGITGGSPTHGNHTVVTGRPGGVGFA